MKKPTTEKNRQYYTIYYTINILSLELTGSKFQWQIWVFYHGYSK